MSTLKRYLLFQFSKPELNWLSTVLGLLSTICIVLVSNQVGNKQVLSSVGGISGGILSVLINSPAKVSPNTEETEELEQSISKEQNS